MFRKRKRTKGTSNQSKKSKSKKRRKIVQESEDEAFCDVILNEGDIALNDGDVALNEGDIASFEGGDLDVSDGGPHNCDKCNYIGRTKLHLIRHEQNQHSETKPCKLSWLSSRGGLVVELWTDNSLPTVNTFYDLFCHLCMSRTERRVGRLVVGCQVVMLVYPIYPWWLSGIMNSKFK